MTMKWEKNRKTPHTSQNNEMMRWGMKQDDPWAQEWRRSIAGIALNHQKKNKKRQKVLRGCPLARISFHPPLPLCKIIPFNHTQFKFSNTKNIKRIQPVRPKPLPNVRRKVENGRGKKRRGRGRRDNEEEWTVGARTTQIRRQYCSETPRERK